MEVKIWSQYMVVLNLSKKYFKNHLAHKVFSINQTYLQIHNSTIKIWTFHSLKAASTMVVSLVLMESRRRNNKLWRNTVRNRNSHRKRTPRWIDRWQKGAQTMVGEHKDLCLSNLITTQQIPQNSIQSYPPTWKKYQKNF